MPKHWLYNLTFSSTTFTLENYVNDLKNHLEIMPCLKSVRAFFWATLITIYRPQVGYKKTLHPLFSLSKLSWRFLLILLCFINWSSIESPQYICTQTLENQHHSQTASCPVPWEGVLLSEKEQSRSVSCFCLCSVGWFKDYSVMAPIK